jgi:hypothetical protein
MVYAPTGADNFSLPFAPTNECKQAAAMSALGHKRTSVALVCRNWCRVEFKTLPDGLSIVLLSRAFSKSPTTPMYYKARSRSCVHHKSAHSEFYVLSLQFKCALREFVRYIYSPAWLSVTRTESRRPRYFRIVSNYLRKWLAAVSTRT